MATTDEPAGLHPTEDETRHVESGRPVVELNIAGSEPLHPASPSTANLPSLSLFSLSGQGIIITGGARGLGLCLAIAILEAGAARVYCLDILSTPDTEEWARAEKTAEKYGGKIEYRKLDITDEDASREMFESLFNESEGEVPISGVFASAGIQQMLGVLDYPAKDFRRIMDVNVTGTFLTMQSAAREMIKRKIKGSIAIVASMSGSVTNQGLTCIAYNTSKSALLQMARSAAAEFGPHGIRVNTLSPGYIRTAMTDELLAQRPDFAKQWLSGSMLERLSTPDEFRGPVIYLLSRASSFMTGADLIVDGGHTAW